MATPQEQVAQIEAALRRRFFAHVPKVERSDRAGWDEARHDTDRLSRALAAYALVGLCGLDDVTAVGAITDGQDDGGIDALLYHRPENRLVLIQAKFKRGGAAPAQDEVLKTINGVKALIERRFDGFNQSFQARLDEIEEALDTPGVRIQIVIAFLGDTPGVHATNDLNAFCAEVNRPGDRMSWQAAGLVTVFGWLVAEQTPATVNVQVALENWATSTAPRRAFYGQMSAAAIVALVAQHGKALFERNIRHYLGSYGVNTAIETSVRRAPGDFFYLNNGLTALARAVTPAVGTRERCTFGLTGFSIVNGAQTAGAIANAAVRGGISPDAKVLITIIEIGDGADDIGLRITRARNHQNVVRGIDFAALDPQQERLRQELACVGITYHYRPSAEARARRDDAFTVEEAALALACLTLPVRHSRELQRHLGNPPPNAVDSVVTAKKEIGRLWDQEGPHYARLFPPALSGLRMCRLVRIYRLLDAILAGSEHSETTYFRRMFFRHGRYFIMAFVTHRLPDVIARTELNLSDDDKRALSQRTNELAELIYARSQPLQGYKGYLAIFRNLTDAQPLADNVLDHLAALDAGPTAPPDGSQPAQPPGTMGL